MGRITQRTAPDPLARKLAAAGARAAIALECDGSVDPLPALHRHHDGAHWVGVAREALPDAATFERAVLVADDGQWWFELRAVTWRGLAERADAPPFEDYTDLVWLRFEPRGAIAWDYGRLHEAPDEEDA
jgi:hypothetical protein